MVERKHVFCVGAAKAGTTWLSEQFRHHPSFYLPPMKEIHYFQSRYGTANRLTSSRRLHGVAKFMSQSSAGIAAAENQQKRLALLHRQADLVQWYQRYASGRINDAWYLGLFEGAGDGRYLCDFSAAGCKISEKGVRAMRQLSNQTYVIYLLRNPFDRLVSHAKFHAQLAGDFEWMQGATRSQIENYVAKLNLIDDSLYAQRILQFRKHFGDDRFIVLDFDELCEQPLVLLDRLATFLSVPEFSPLPVSRKPNRGPDFTFPKGALDAFRRETDKEVERLVSIGVEFAAKWRRGSQRRSFLARWRA